MVRAGLVSLVLACGLLAIWSPGAIWGQEPRAAAVPATGATEPAAEPAPASPASRPAGPTNLEASELDTFLLKDNKGNYVPVLGLSFEEFERLMKIKRGLAPPAPPNYTLDALSITGTADKDIANLQVSATIRVRETGWIRIPLKLSGAVLRKGPAASGQSDYFITADPDDHGYLCWLQGDADSKHQIALQFAVPIEEVGDERRIDLVLPRATEGTLRLEVPLEQAESYLRNGSSGLVSVKPASNKKSAISVLGAAGDLQLAWRASRPAAAATPNVLEVSGEVVVKVEGRTRIGSEARLKVRGTGAALESFRVRIPPGMELAPASAAGYSTTVVSSATSSADARQVVEVKLDRPTTAAMEIRLAANLAPGKPTASFEPASWEVIGAARQRGTIDVQVEGDWHLQWTENPAVRRIDTPSDATLARTAARFEYFRQPCNLKLQVSPRPTRVSVNEPNYILYVDAQQTRLEATLRYRIRGTKAASLVIDPGDWQLDRISPDLNVDPDSMVIQEGKPWELPLRETAAGEFELKIEAHRPSPKSGDTLQMTLPRPLGDMVTPATVVVMPADNVQLVPDLSAIRGLTADTLPATIQLPARQQPPLVFRDLGGGEAVQFAAQFQIRSRKTAVNTASLVQIDRRHIQVEQRLSYRISFEPQRTFALLVPAELQRATGLHVSLGEELLPLEPADDVREEAPATLYHFIAPADQIGPCEFVVRYTLPLPSLTPGQTTAVPVPLATPADHDEIEFSNHSVAVTYADEVQLQSVTTDQDARAAAPEVIGPRRLEIPLLRPVTQIECHLLPVETTRQGLSQIDKVWFQTWLGLNRRQDRAVWRFTPRQAALRIRLPQAVEPSDVSAAVNGQRLANVEIDDSTIHIELPPTDVNREIVLELWYSMPRVERTWGVATMQLEPPLLDGGVAIRRLYWHVCTPDAEHLVVEPNDFAAELHWAWKGLFWARSATLDQDDLERWIGASTQEPPPEGVNHYLFSGFGRVEPLRMVTASQRTLVAGISFAVLAVGLVLVYVRRARSPVLVFVGAVALGAVGFAAPDTALFLGQAAVVGLVVVLVTSFTWWLIWGRNVLATVSPTAITQIQPVDSKSTEVPSPRVDRTPAQTASTAPLGMAAESRP